MLSCWTAARRHSGALFAATVPAFAHQRRERAAEPDHPAPLCAAANGDALPQAVVADYRYVKSCLLRYLEKTRFNLGALIRCKIALALRRLIWDILTTDYYSSDH
ncbi:hypothetical protein BOSEA1005_11751 [Hyphomicrobiales bacterium]|nr:hypothetical protein BOSEA1005_11751 [Hyphomicrobiales bacterium]CAI0342344.1 hypothetical protein BO1005MUT1_180123 [Hyphomicrobiales bacterium]